MFEIYLIIKPYCKRKDSYIGTYKSDYRTSTSDS